MGPTLKKSENNGAEPLRKKQKCCNPKCKEPDDSVPLRYCERCKTEAYCSRSCKLASRDTHTKECVRPNYLIEVHLSPADRFMFGLHGALQVAFGWGTRHAWEFRVPGREFDPSRNPKATILELMAEMESTRADPEIIVEGPGHLKMPPMSNEIMKEATKYKIWEFLEESQQRYTFSFHKGRAGPC